MSADSIIFLVNTAIFLVAVGLSLYFLERPIKHENDSQASSLTLPASKHELIEFQPCTFGDGGFDYHDGADRALCSCGWVSAPVQRDKSALVALWKIHSEQAQPAPQYTGSAPRAEHCARH